MHNQYQITMKNLEVIESMPGWCTIEKATKLYDIVIESNSQLTIELGVFGGRSLLPLAFAHKHKDSGVVIGVDAWNKFASLEGTNDPANNEWWEKIDYNEIYDGCAKAIQDNHLYNWCSIIRMKSEQFAILCPDNSVDVIHADSNHSEEITTKEVQLFLPKLKPGGIWIADDTGWPTLQKAISMLSEQCEVIDKQDNYMIFKKN